MINLDCSLCDKEANQTLIIKVTIKKKTRDIYSCLPCAKKLAYKVGIDPEDVYFSDSLGYDI